MHPALIALIIAGVSFIIGVLAAAREAHDSNLAKAFLADANRVGGNWAEIAFDYTRLARRNETAASYWNSLTVLATISLTVSLAMSLGLAIR